MKEISFWARSHKWVARILIVILFLTLNVLGIINGKLLSEISISLPFSSFLAVAGLYGIAFIIYPKKKRVSNYLKQKICDLLLGGSVFGMFVYLGNNIDMLATHSSLNSVFANTRPLPTDSVKRDYKSIKEFSVLLKDSKGNFLKWKERKRLLKYQLKEIKKDDNLSTGAKIFLIFLSVAAALGLLYLIAALSCSLSCSGSDGLAVLVALGGLSLTIILLIVLIRVILGIKKKKKRDNKNEDKTPVEN